MWPGQRKSVIYTKCTCSHCGYYSLYSTWYAKSVNFISFRIECCIWDVMVLLSWLQARVITFLILKVTSSFTYVYVGKAGFLRPVSIFMMSSFEILAEPCYSMCVSIRFYVYCHKQNYCMLIIITQGKTHYNITYFNQRLLVALISHQILLQFYNHGYSHNWDSYVILQNRDSLNITIAHA